MSHYSAVKTKIKRKSDLVSALKSMNNGKWKNCIEVHDTPQNLIGYDGDVREQKADIIIRRHNISSSSNDIGFVRQQDGTYQAVISDYDRTSQRYNSEWLDKLSQQYSYEVVKSTAVSNGFTFEFAIVDGEIHVTCEKD